MGVLQLLYTPSAMIIAQTIIIFPIVTSLSHEIFSKNWYEFKDQIRSLNIPFFGSAKLLFNHSYFLLITTLLSAFGRAISEVGAVMIVGGNIDQGPNQARRPEKSNELSELIRQRKVVRCPSLRRTLNKSIQKCTRRGL